MRTVTYDSILRGSVELAGQTFPPLAQDGLTWRGWIEKELQTAWEAEFWPDLMRAEQRYLRDLFLPDGAYLLGDEVYYPTEKKYYHAIRNGTGNFPTDMAWWAESKLSYPAADHSTTRTYAVGDQVYYPYNDTFYQCHTAHAPSHLPEDVLYWGPLKAFIPDVVYEQTGKTPLGDVMGVWNRNPRVFTTAGRLPFRLTERGVCLLGGSRSTVWVEYRIRPLKLLGEVFNALSAYAVNDQVYLSPDFYTCIATTAAGESPVTHAAKWTVVALPEIFKSYVIHASYVRWLRSDGQNDKAAQEGSIATAELVRAGLSLARGQRQSRGLEVLTR